MLASNMDGKLDSIQDKQDCQLAGVTYLLQFIEPNDGRLPDRRVQFIEDGGKLQDRLAGLQRPVITRSGKQGEFPVDPYVRSTLIAVRSYYSTATVSHSDGYENRPQVEIDLGKVSS